MLDNTITDLDIDQVLEELNAGAASSMGRLVLDEGWRDALRRYTDVQACPGSGKTTLVGIKLLCLARKWRNPKCGICVLTHTNVAKEEVLARLRQLPVGHKLLSYPHFIGTIQEFVNTFLALPACHSKGLIVARIDDEFCTKRLDKAIGRTASTYLTKRHASISELRYVWRDGSLKLNVPGFDHESNSQSYRDLQTARSELMESGVYFYSEMYTFAQELIAANPSVAETLRCRFPVAIIDEMQDVQKFQDDLINGIFGGGRSLLQRFGDPDQSIFDGLGGEEPNESYNDAALQQIAMSHRFVPDVAHHITGLSQRKLTISCSRASVQGAPPNAIILCDDSTRGLVLNRYAEIVRRLERDSRRTVKAVGAVGENEPGATNPLNIRSYWAEFDRTRNLRTSVPASFCQAVQYCSDLLSGDAVLRHEALICAVIETLRRAGKSVAARNSGKLPSISRSNLPRFLRLAGTEREFRLLIATLMIAPMQTETGWLTITALLRRLLTIDEETQSVREYLAFDARPLSPQTSVMDTGNTYKAQNGINIQVSTIHAAKGETHDATLICETKHRRLFDVAEMLPFILDKSRAVPRFDPAHPMTDESIRSGFMKKLYVAASRPRHLLCLAVGRQRVSPEQRADLLRQRWQIVEV